VSPLPSADLITLSRPNAVAGALDPGTPIWYRQSIAGGYGHDGHLVPGVFRHYGNVRVAVVLFDTRTGRHRVYVSPHNVYPRWPEDGPHEGVRP